MKIEYIKKDEILNYTLAIQSYQMSRDDKYRIFAVVGYRDDLDKEMKQLMTTVSNSAFN